MILKIELKNLFLNYVFIQNIPQPLKESYLMSDNLEPTNQWYAVAKTLSKIMSMR